MLRALGYKELVEKEIPEYNPERQYLSPFYEDGEENIIKHWEIKNDV